MRYLIWFLTIPVLFWNLYALILAEEKAHEKVVKEIPIEWQFFKKETLESFPGIKGKEGYFIWPTAKDISTRVRLSDESLADAEKKRVIPHWLSREKETVTEAKRMAEKWIRAVIKDSWIPDDIYSRLIALDAADANDYDTISVRYEIAGYYIQIVQTNQEIALTIKSTKPMTLTPSEVLNLFFTKATEIKENALSQPLDVFPSGSYGRPRDTLNKPEDANQYWGHTYWWTDGESFAFLIWKFYGGKGRPGGRPVDKDWF